MTEGRQPAGGEDSASRVPSLLHQAWWHSFEEDHDGVVVYRPAAFSFPRARGRGGLEFRADGTLVDVGAGPGDAPRTQPGSWAPDTRDRLRVTGPAGERTLRIVNLSPERLELEPGDG